MISIEVDGTQLNRELKRLNSRLRDLEPPLRGFGNYLKRETERQFEREVDPDGVRWAELAPSTLLSKRRAGYPDDILTRTGEMRRSLDYIAAKKSLSFGSKGSQAVIDRLRRHQEGTINMQQRRVIGMNRPREQKLSKLVRVYVQGRRRR